jgi:hypothetical protein
VGKPVDISRTRVEQLVAMDAVPNYVVLALLAEIDRLHHEHDEDMDRMERAAIAIEDMTRQLNSRAAQETTSGERSDDR